MGYRGLIVNKTNAPQKNTLEKKTYWAGFCKLLKNCSTPYICTL